MGSRTEDGDAECQTTRHAHARSADPPPWQRHGVRSTSPCTPPRTAPVMTPPGPSAPWS